MALTPEQRREGVYDRLTIHVQHFFAGHAVTEHRPDTLRVYEHLPRFRVLQVAPGPKTQFWTYISLGAWEKLGRDLTSFEFLLIAPAPDDAHLRLLGMLAYYHTLDDGRLGLGHTLPLGQPWLPQSTCDHLLICHPYPYGYELEHCVTEDFTVHLLWALPITAAERDYKRAHGLEALEQQFDEAAIAYWEPQRASAV